jgi:hypothetical protein
MAGWYSLWSLGTFFPFWYVWTQKNLATMTYICIEVGGCLFILLPEAYFWLHQRPYYFFAVLFQHEFAQ